MDMKCSLYSGKYPKHFVPVALVALLGIVVVGIRLVQQHLAQRLEPCSSTARIPIIEEVGPNYVILGGNGFTLRKGGTYQFGNSWLDVRVRLIDVDDGEATLVYGETQYYAGEADSIPAHALTVLCKHHVTQDGEAFQHHLLASLLQPEDIDPGWTVNQYTAYVVRYYDPIPPRSLIYAQLETTRAVGDPQIPYTIYISVLEYETEEIAREVFVAEEETFNDPFKRQSSYRFESQAASYAEGCASFFIWRRVERYPDPFPGHSCLYVGKYDHYILAVSMSALIEGMPNGHGVIPLEDWKYVAGLAEAKLLNGLPGIP
jgi:hypothetical protein